MSKWNLERFTGGRRAVELEEGATKGATVGVDLFYNGVLVLWEDIYNGAESTPTPVIGISDWSLLLNIPPRVTALENQAGTGIYVLTGASTSVVRSIDGTATRISVSNANGVAGNPKVDLIDTAVTPGAYVLANITVGPDGRITAASNGAALSNPMTTLGDIVVGDVSGTPDRLGIGATDQVLGVVAGVPGYVDRVIEVQAGTNVTVDNTDPMRPIVSATGGGGSANGGIGISIGTYDASASALVAGTEVSSIADGGYSLTGEWYMWCYPSGSVTIDVWKDSFTNVPTIADSITGGAPPAIAAGTFATATFPGGPIAISRTNTMIAHINASSSVKWVKLLLVGTRT